MNDSGKNHFTLEQCINHRRANSFGKVTDKQKTCKCCHQYLQKQPLSINFNQKDIYECGCGFHLFFSMLKITILMLFLLILVWSVPLLYENYQNAFCNTSTPICSSAIFVLFSSINSCINPSMMRLQSYLLIASAFIIFLLSNVMRRFHKKIVNEAEEYGYFPNQYAVIVHMADENNSVRNQMENWWNKAYKRNKQEIYEKFPELLMKDNTIQFKNESEISEIRPTKMQKQRESHASINIAAIIEKIIVSYDYSEFQQRKAEIYDLEKQIKYNSQLKNEETNIKNLITLTQLKGNMLKKVKKNNLVIIIFKQKQYAEYFLKMNNRSIIEKLVCFQKNQRFKQKQIQVKVEEAVHPSQVNWKSHHIPENKKLLNRILTWLVLVLAALSISGLSFFAIKYLFNSMTSTFPIFSIMLAMLIMVVNQIISAFINYLSEFQYRSTLPSQQINIIYKKLFLYFLDCGILLFFAYYLQFSNTIWITNGFIDTISFIFCFSAIFPILNIYLNIPNIKSLYNFLTLSQKQQISQEQANKLYQKPPNNIKTISFWCVHLILFSCFIAPLLPFTFLISFLSLSILLFFQKINIATLYKSSQIGKQFNKSLISLIQKAPIFMAAGNIILQLTFTQMNNFHLDSVDLAINACIFVLGFYSFIFPTGKISNFVTCERSKAYFQEREPLINQAYATVKETFINTYETQNFAYQHFNKFQSNNPATQTAKVMEELHTMSKTLSASLKDRLLNNVASVLNHAKKAYQQQQNSFQDVYFEYEKRVTMKNASPKIKIPPIYKKITAEHANQPPANSTNLPELDLIKISSLINKDDLESKNKIKNQIKSKISRLNVPTAPKQIDEFPSFQISDDL